jgi:hypothetical protein
MQSGRRILQLARIGAVMLGAWIVLFMATSKDVGAEDQDRFHVEWQQQLVGGRDPALKGFVDNRSQLRVGNVRLRVDALDDNAKVVGQSFGWVIGDVPAGGRAYFVVPITAPGATYRVSVESYDPISAGTGTGGAQSATPSSSPPTSR